MIIYLPNLYLTTGREYIVLAPLIFISSPTPPSKLAVLILQSYDFLAATIFISIISQSFWLIPWFGVFAFVANEVEVTIRWVKGGDYTWAVVSSFAQVEADFAAVTPFYRRVPFGQYFGF